MIRIVHVHRQISLISMSRMFAVNGFKGVNFRAQCLKSLLPNSCLVGFLKAKYIAKKQLLVENCNHSIQPFASNCCYFSLTWNFRILEASRLIRLSQTIKTIKTILAGIWAIANAYSSPAVWRGEGSGIDNAMGNWYFLASSMRFFYLYLFQ